MTIIVRDLMIGNGKLADKDCEFAQGYNAIAAGTQGQRQWTDLYPNFDMVESLLCSSFDWNGKRAPMIVATENDSKNAMGMMIATLLTGLPQMFADIRTNWTAKSIKKATGIDVTDICADGLIDKRNSGAAALDFAVNIYEMTGVDVKEHPYKVAAKIAANPALAEKIVKAAIEATTYTGADLDYFPGDGLSSNYRTPGGVPMTAYRYNCIDNKLTCSVIEGDTVELPAEVASHISKITNETWPEAYWKPRGMSSYEYMSKIGPNHDANSFGYIGADMITINAMLRIPVDMHNVPECDIFRPTMWDRFAGDDYRVCEYLGPIYM
jgi:L-fucose isomerase